MHHIQQQVGGSENAVTATGDVYQVNYHLDSPTADDRRNLVNLLAQVKRTWITDVLEQSIHHAVLLELGMREAIDAVEHPWQRIVHVESRPGVVLPPDRTIGQVFDETGRLLLILGEPGSGKTTTLLALAREWITRAERDLMSPVPVVLSLSTWTDPRSSILDWLVGELSQRYFVGKSHGRQWLRGNRLLLFLDGLDEIAENQRAACVHAIHSFVEEHGVPGLAICCRSEEYQRLPLRLRLRGAVSLLPLSETQVQAYLQAIGPSMETVRAAINDNKELRELTQSPLILSILTIAFHNSEAGALAFERTGGGTALRDQILAEYVERMFTRRRHREARFRERTQGWLSWLARRMADRGETVFSIGSLQPGWLTSTRQWLAYALLSRTIAISAFSLVWAGLADILVMCLYWDQSSSHTSRLSLDFVRSVAKSLPLTLAFGCLCGIFTGVLSAIADFVRLSFTRTHSTRQILSICLTFLAFSMLGGTGHYFASTVARNLAEYPYVTVEESYLWGIGFAVFFGVKKGRGSREADIGRSGVMKWKWNVAARTAAICGAVTAASDLVVLSAEGRSYPLLMFLVGAFIGAVFGGWRYAVPSPNAATPDGLAGKAMKGAVVIAALTGASGAAIDYAAGSPWLDSIANGLAFAMFFGALGFLWLGGIDLLLHFALRVVLAGSGVMPYRLHSFLNDAVNLVFLRRAGNSHIFIHQLLLQHFADSPAAVTFAPGQRGAPPRG